MLEDRSRVQEAHAREHPNCGLKGSSPDRGGGHCSTARVFMTRRSLITGSDRIPQAAPVHEFQQPLHAGGQEDTQTGWTCSARAADADASAACPDARTPSAARARSRESGNIYSIRPVGLAPKTLTGGPKPAAGPRDSPRAASAAWSETVASESATAVRALTARGGASLFSPPPSEK